MRLNLMAYSHDLNEVVLKTRQFLKDFRLLAVIYYSCAQQKSASQELVDKSREYLNFLTGLLDGDNLIKYFPELQVRD